jgi:hypothetical protein
MVDKSKGDTARKAASSVAELRGNIPISEMIRVRLFRRGVRTCNERPFSFDYVLQYLQHRAFVVRDTQQRDVIARVQFSAAISIVKMFAFHQNIAPCRVLQVHVQVILAHLTDIAFELEQQASGSVSCIQHATQNHSRVFLFKRSC